MRPTLLSSCAIATTREEAAFRLDYPLAAARETRVVGLDAEATAVVRWVAEQDIWAQAQFYTAVGTADELETLDGRRATLDSALDRADSLLMVAAGGDASSGVTIGAACQARGIMTAGLIMTPGGLDNATVATLRPYARMLLVPAEPDDLLELLRAMRA